MHTAEERVWPNTQKSVFARGLVCARYMLGRKDFHEDNTRERSSTPLACHVPNVDY